MIQYRLNTIVAFVLVLLGLSACQVKTEKQKQQPNIVIIMADDLGYSDLACYGGELNTPHIDQLASEGLRFSQFYNGARCCPSRASLLTGQYSHVAGIGHMTEDRGKEAYQGRLSQNVLTIAEVLKLNGYQTMMTGKWHVTDNIERKGDISNWPIQRGFDKFYGTLPGYGSFWDPAGLYNGNEAVKAIGDYFYTDAMTDTTISYIHEAIDKDEPFFMYVAYAAPHYPLHAREEYIVNNKGKFDAGWDVLRAERLKRLKEKGLINSDVTLANRDEQSIPWEDEPYKQWQSHRMEVFGAMVEQMDAGIGRIMQTLKDVGADENTIVIFLSDNGGSAEGHLYNTIERWGKPWKSKLIPELAPNGEKMKAGDWPDEPLGGPTTFGSYGVKWANLSNAPFQRHKSWLHEGGISTPFIVRWPAQIANTGAIRHTPTHLIDVMATCIDISSSDYPKVVNERMIHSYEGESLASLFKGESTSGRPLFWEHEGNRAIRYGDWKLVSEFPGTWAPVRAYEKQGQWELYNIVNDRTETTDLASEMPEKVKELEALWQQWANRVGVIPWDELVKEDY